LTVRLTTSSRSDVRSAVVGFFVVVALLSLLSAITLLLLFQFTDDRVQLVEARRPQLAIALDPKGQISLEPPRRDCGTTESSCPVGRHGDLQAAGKELLVAR